MKNIKNRLMKLETSINAPAMGFAHALLDGTREEVNAQRAVIDAGNERVCARVIVPHIGESINDYRRANGIPPMAVPGWDQPCALEE